MPQKGISEQSRHTGGTATTPVHEDLKAKHCSTRKPIYQSVSPLSRTSGARAGLCHSQAGMPSKAMASLGRAAKRRRALAMRLMP